ncbi:hypothetical protein ANTPLA_LOCUS2104 [Anthophora plagiata]
MLQSSATRIPEVEDATKIGYGFKTNWEDNFQSQRVQRLSPTGKRIRMNYESNKEANLIESDPTERSANYYEYRRYTIENTMEMQLHVRITSEAVRNLWKIGTNIQQQFAQQRMHLQCYQIQQQREQSCPSKERQQQFYYTFQYRPLILRTEYQTARTKTYGMSKHLPPVLSPEVPEFFPKVPITRFGTVKEQNTNRVQYFPSLNERSYQNELFPYNRTHDNTGTIYQGTAIPLMPITDTTTFIRPPQQWYQRIPPPTQIQISNSSSTPMCTSVQPLRATTITHHPLQVQEKFLQANPIPIPVYQHPIELYHETGQKRKNQGVDFKNLILLTKNAMKVHRGHSKTIPQKPSSYSLERRNRDAKSEAEVLQWLDNSCSSKTKEFTTTNSLVSELRSFEGKNDRKASSSRREKDNSKSSERMKPEVQGTSSKVSNERDKNDTRNRRRLYRDVLTNASANQAILENVFEKRYDELEQQAMEQYRTSEESLALKYQELERQAMEQYKCCGGNVQEDVLSVSRVSSDDKQMNDDSTRTSKEVNCLDGQKCTGFGKCSPVNTDEEKEEKEVISYGRVKTNRKISYESKNTAKGASDDKMDKSVSVRASSKRRLILVSPFEKESEAKLTRSTDLEEFYCITQANKNIFGYYNNSKVGQIGGGDENITIIQSPRTEVWLSGFWTT